MSTEAHAFTWKFHRIGGLDQVVLRTAEELRHLRELDPKVWVALSCPTTGIELDHRTLQLVDTNNDGRIRVPEVLDAVEWVCARLKDPADIVDAPADLPLDRINTESPEGGRLHDSAKMVLANIGKPGAESISPEDVSKALEIAGQLDFNGDGVMPQQPSFDADVNQFIQDALDVIGGVPDASGKPGINREIADAFVATLQQRKAWKESVGSASTPLGDDTEEGWSLIEELKPKIDDYFLRCDLAAFAPTVTLASANHGAPDAADEEKLQEILDQAVTAHPACAAHGLLETDALADLPLAKIEPDRPLSLSKELNPAWRDAVERFAKLMQPLLSTPGTLTRDDWKAVQKAFAGYEKIFSDKPEPVTVKTAIPPKEQPAQLPMERVEAVVSGNVVQRFNELLQRDADAPSATGDIADLERLVLYHGHLYRLLMNFVSFYDFYSLYRRAAFQAGTLFIDGRSCKLCLPVIDVDKHAALAAHSQLCLLYCDCTRVPEKGGEAQTRKIVAAMTAGGSETLSAGRNGVYIDDNGDDWDATVTRIVSNPISLRQAIWDPYQRFGKMVTTQINKFASSKQSEATDKLQKLAATTVTAPASSKFDIGRSVGIFAAIGLALGAIGTAAATIIRALLSLSWWQLPLLFLLLFLLVSGPSVFLAWLKLRKRTLGPLLEASGWAVNGQVPINLFLGGELTSEAQLPPNSSRSYNDPLYKKKKRWPYVVAIVLIAALLGLGGWVWLKERAAVSKWFQHAAATMEETARKPPASPPAAQ